MKLFPLLVTVVLCARALGAQGLPVFKPLESERGECRFGKPNAALLRTGITRIAVFMPEGDQRRVSVALGQESRVLMVSAYYIRRVSAKRTERETATAMFNSDGSFRFGNRSFHVIKVPAARNEDRDARLSPADIEAARKLGASISRRCT